MARLGDGEMEVREDGEDYEYYKIDLGTKSWNAEVKRWVEHRREGREVAANKQRRK